MTNPTTLGALRKIAAKNKGVLRPEDVVEAARPAQSPLHGNFTWDDAVAGDRYRLWEARQLIRTTIQYIEVNGEERACRVFCSLTPDRTEKGGGYREMTVVLANRAQVEQLLADAYREMVFFQRKYGHLQELAAVILAMKSVTEHVPKLPPQRETGAGRAWPSHA